MMRRYWSFKVTGDTAADFTQIPTAPQPQIQEQTNTTQLATTAFVIAQQSESYSLIEAFEKYRLLQILMLK
jgi:hypothetical protein